MCEIAEPDEYCTVWQWDERRARKAYRCDSCKGPITKSETYHFHKNLFDGVWTTERQCAACWAAESEFSAAHGDLSFSPSQFAEALVECIDEDDEADQKWVAMREAMAARRASP
jgi:hypothetical protein